MKGYAMDADKGLREIRYEISELFESLRGDDILDMILTILMFPYRLITGAIR